MVKKLMIKQKKILEIYKKHRSINIHKMKNIPIFKKMIANKKIFLIDGMALIYRAHYAI